MTTIAEKMTEVERKFIVTDTVLAHIRRLAEGRGTPTCRLDIYYDSDDYFLTARGWWLRTRNGKFELKRRVNGTGLTLAHTEDTDTDTILEALGITGELGADLLERHGVYPFASLYTERETLHIRNLTIDIDTCTAEAGSFTYRVGEIELMVPEGEVRQAEKDIDVFAQELGIRYELIRGKLIEYLATQVSKHYRVLVSAGVIDPNARSATS